MQTREEKQLPSVRRPLYEPDRQRRKCARKRRSGYKRRRRRPRSHRSLWGKGAWKSSCSPPWRSPPPGCWGRTSPTAAKGASHRGRITHGKCSKYLGGVATFYIYIYIYPVQKSQVIVGEIHQTLDQETTRRPKNEGMSGRNSSATSRTCAVTIMIFSSCRISL